MSEELYQLIRKKVLLLDGAMGTMLQNKGLKPGECPEVFGINHPDILGEIHYQYIHAGSDIIQTNTFGGNRFKLAEYGLGDEVVHINTEAVQIAKQKAAGRALVAASIGPTGKLLHPMGDVVFDDLYEVYKEQAIACEKAGADLLSIETMTDIGEMRAALIAARYNTKIPVIAHMSFEAGGRTLMGTDPITALVILEALQPLAIGANCSGGARELLPVIQTMSSMASVFLSVEPNAGIPYLRDGQTIFPDTPEEMAEYAILLKDAGANIIGGCCGTTPEHIQAMSSALSGFSPLQRDKHKIFAFASRSKTVFLDKDHPLAFIGERINPTARKKLAEDIKAGRMSMVLEEARRQVESGAPMLDVNMGVPGIDEIKAMGKAVSMIQSAVDVPVSIDTTNARALEKGLKTFVGRPLINSTTGEEKSLDIILPLAKKYGAAVLGLCLDEEGIPDNAEKRLEIARKIYNKAKEYGLRDEDIFIDSLVKTASAEQWQVMQTIYALKMVKDELGVGTVLGVSNVSHGLPGRDILNSTFLAMAWAAGLDLPIMNPFDERMMAVTRAAGVLLNRDPGCSTFIEKYRDYKDPVKSVIRSPICEKCNIPDLINNGMMPGNAISKVPENNPVTIEDDSLEEKIKSAVLKGDSDSIGDLIKQALFDKHMPALEIVNKALIPGIERAGDLYDRKEYFLPQLMRAADTMKAGFNLVKPYLSEESGQKLGKIVLATVEGDIHDIGKNITAVLLENYGFEIIDLGKDVKAETILDAAEQQNADIIGLSALMTTTMPRMQEVIKGARERGLRAKVMVGGAVLTEDYAKSIGADGFSEDARAAVSLAKRLIDGID